MTTPNSKLQHPGIAMSFGNHTNPHDDHKDEDLSELKRETNSVGGSFSARLPRSSAEVRRVFVHHLVEVEVVGQ